MNRLVFAFIVLALGFSFSACGTSTNPQFSDSRKTFPSALSDMNSKTKSENERGEPSELIFSMIGEEISIGKIEAIEAFERERNTK